MSDTAVQHMRLPAAAHLLPSAARAYLDNGQVAATLGVVHRHVHPHAEEVLVDLRRRSGISTQRGASVIECQLVA